MCLELCSLIFKYATKFLFAIFKLCTDYFYVLMARQHFSLLCFVSVDVSSLYNDNGFETREINDLDGTSELKLG